MRINVNWELFPVSGCEYVGVRKLSSRVAEDKKLFGVIIAIWIVQACIAIGPLRSQLEEMVLFSLMPGVDLLFTFFKLFDNIEPGTVWFYIQFFVIIIRYDLMNFLPRAGGLNN